MSLARLLSKAAAPQSTFNDKKAINEKPLIHSTLFGSIDINSVTSIVKESEEVVIYGFGSCHYEDIYSILTAILDRNIRVGLIKLMHDFSVRNTLEGTNISRVQYKGDVGGLKRQCKTTVTNIVLENLLRLQTNKKIIPVIFCIDTDNNPYPFSIENMLTKEAALNFLITHAELRRICKLCTDPDPEIQRAAIETFKFVKVRIMSDKAYQLQEVPAPYASADYQKYLTIRKHHQCQDTDAKVEAQPALTTSEATESTPKPYAWRPQLLEQLSLFRKRKGSAQVDATTPRKGAAAAQPSKKEPTLEPNPNPAKKPKRA